MNRPCFDHLESVSAGPVVGVDHMDPPVAGQPPAPGVIALQAHTDAAGAQLPAGAAPAPAMQLFGIVAAMRSKC